MLRIEIEQQELWNEEAGVFQYAPASVLILEHSLVSLSKWESKNKVPFLSGTEKTAEEIMDYVIFMVVEGDPMLISRLSQENLERINDYVGSGETATTFGTLPERQGRGETITSELIYYWLVAYNIPFEVERWHLSRLLALVRICNVKNSKPSKATQAQIAERNRQINEDRRKKLGTSG